MAFVDLTRTSTLSVHEAWRRVTDWEAQEAYFPFTTVRLDSGGRAGLGVRFTAHTGIGRFGFDDPMEVTEWRPPTDYEAGATRLQKLGPRVTGWAYVTVVPTPEGTSVVNWHEEARFHPPGSIADLPITIMGHRIFGRMLDHLLADEPPEETEDDHEEVVADGR